MNQNTDDWLEMMQKVSHLQGKLDANTTVILEALAVLKKLILEIRNKEIELEKRVSKIEQQ